MGLAAIITIIVNNLTTLGLSPTITAFLGLILGEIGKAISNKLENKPLGFQKI